MRIIELRFSFCFSVVVSRPSRPSPSVPLTDVISSHEPELTLTDAHYDRLETLLMEKIQAHIQAGMNKKYNFYNKD